MRYAIILFLCPTLTVLAADPPATSPADPLAESRRIDEEIRKLHESAIARQMAAIAERRKAAQERSNKEANAIEEEINKLRETPNWREFENRLDELKPRRDEKWEIERKAMAEAARRMYSARHEELRKLAAAAMPQAGQLGLDILSYPRVDGSTSTHPLNVIIAARIMGVPYEWAYPEPTGSAWGDHPELPLELFLEERREWGGGYSDRDVEFRIAASRVFAKPREVAEQRQHRLAVMINSVLAANSNTHDAYVNLIEGRCDLNFTAREPSASELKLARDKGVELKLVPIAKDALVFIVNHRNPVAGLTSAQLQAIYKDKTTRWKDVGGVAPKEGEDKILALWRQRDSGSRELFDGLLMKGEPLPEPTDERRPMMLTSVMGTPFSRVTENAQAISYSVYYYEHFMSLSPHTKTIAVDGVEPTAETIASGKYPFVSPVYAAYRANQPADSPAMKLLNWLLSPEGQAVVRESGYVPAK